MQLGLVSRTPRFVANEETLDIAIKITLDKNEAPISGQVALELAPIENFDASTGISSASLVIAVLDNISIPSGGSATLRFVGKTHETAAITAITPDDGAARRYIYGVGVSADHAGGYHYAHMMNVGYILTRRQPPEITEFSVSDATGGLEYFGQLAQGQSDITIQAAYSLDPLIPGLTGSERMEAIFTDGQTGETITLLDRQDAAGAYRVPGIPAAGELLLRYTVTDAYGISAVHEQRCEVFSYYSPVLSELHVERYKAVTLDDGSVEYRAAPDGNRVWISLQGQTCAVLSKNGWTLSVEYGGKTAEIAFGADGAAFAYSLDRALIPDEIPVDSRMEFTFRLSDFFGFALATQAVEKAGADLHVTKYGTAVGQRSTGEMDHRKFEVSPTHEAFFYGGISGVTNYALEETPTGGHWIDGKPVYRKTLAVNVAAANTIWTSEAIADFDRLVNLWGTLTRTATGTQFPFIFWAAANNYHYTNVNPATGSVYVYSTAVLSGYITVEYTKTTDF